MTKCLGCHSFEKVTAFGLCKVCNFYAVHALFDRVPNNSYEFASREAKKSSTDLVTSAMENVLGFNAFREGQEEAIRSYINNTDTFVILKTGGGKTAIYAASSLISEGLTVVFSPLKALLNDQVVCKVDIFGYFIH